MLYLYVGIIFLIRANHHLVLGNFIGGTLYAIMGLACIVVYHHAIVKG